MNIKKMLKKKHSRINDIRIYMDEINEKNELNDEMKTLKGYGVQGGSKQNPSFLKLFYDFTPFKNGGPEPIILAWTV